MYSALEVGDWKMGTPFSGPSNWKSAHVAKSCKAVRDRREKGRCKEVQSYKLRKWKRALRTARDVEQAVPVNCWRSRVPTKRLYELTRTAARPRASEFWRNGVRALAAH